MLLKNLMMRLRIFRGTWRSHESFCFCEIYSLVLNTKTICLGPQKFFFGGKVSTCFPKTTPYPALCMRHLSGFFCFQILCWLDLFTTQVRNCFSYKLAIVQQLYFKKQESVTNDFIRSQTQTQNVFNEATFRDIYIIYIYIYIYIDTYIYI